MSGFTSGRPGVHHDPTPYLYQNGNRSDRPPVWGASRDGRFMPRLELDHHNPVLMALRDHVQDGGYYGAFLIALDEPAENEAITELIDRYMNYARVETLAEEQAYQTHAYPIVQRLAALENDALGDGTAPPEENFWDDRTTPLAYSEGDSKRDLAVKRTALVGQLLPDRYVLVQADDEVKRDLELRCTDCGHHLCDAEHDDALLVLVSVAIEHETRRHL